MIELKIATIFICGGLFSWGGFNFIEARRFIMPLFLGIAVSIIIGIFWIGILILPVMGSLCVGYRGGKALIRGLWLCLQSLIIGFGVMIFHHLGWYFYIPYALGAFVLGATLYNLQQIFGDFIFGAFLGSIVFLVH